MKANYDTSPQVTFPGAKPIPVSRREARLIEQTRDAMAAYHERDNEELIRVVLETVLLALHRRYGWGARVLREIWQDSIVLRGEARHDLRDGTPYAETDTGKNVEDIGIRLELEKIGVDVKVWESGVTYDKSTGEVTFT